MTEKKVLPLYWLGRMVEGVDEEFLQGLSDKEQEEFWNEVTEQDLEDRDPWPVLASSSSTGEKTLCFFSSKERVWELADRFYKPNRIHPITRQPMTLDDLQVLVSDDTDRLLAVCDEAAKEQGATSGIINPAPEFFDLYSASLAFPLPEIKEKIQRKAEDCAS